MNETTRRFARLVDLSAVQATSTEADVRACAELAARYNIISVHVLPCWTRFLSTLLPQQGTGEVIYRRGWRRVVRRFCQRRAANGAVRQTDLTGSPSAGLLPRLLRAF